MNRRLVLTSLMLALGAFSGHTTLTAGSDGAAATEVASTVEAAFAVQGRLREGRNSNHYVWLDAGSRYLIAGNCDSDCLDLDLRLFSPGGVEIDNDLLPDDVPMVSTTAQGSGRYRVEVIMAHCAVEPCRYELITEER